MLFSCNRDDDVALYPDTLEGYIQSQSHFDVSGEVIACAARVPALTPGLDSSIAIFFYPESESYDYKLFLTEGGEAGAPGNSAFNGAGYIDPDPVFGGALKKFVLDSARREQWAVVTYVQRDMIHISEPIQIKGAERPTEYSSEVNISGSGPTFCWSDGLHTDNSLYLQVISDGDGNMISGTFTQDKCYTHYQLDNVVMNITDTGNDPNLEFAEWYRFTLMAISPENWVNLVIETDFFAP